MATNLDNIFDSDKIWSKLRHPHILQFLGANILDERPFIVMPLLKNGNCRDYLKQYPNGDRLQILYDISLALVHLHSHQIVHGDLKGLNILIDDSTKAVLCDFGLSRIKADAASRTIRGSGVAIVGSRNWMAPEQLLGGSPKKPCDIYAFGLTVSEIFANEIPLGHINHADFLPLVVERNVRPERPDGDNAPQLSDTIWELAKKCWVKDPKCRPSATAVCDTLSHLLSTSATARPASTPSFTLPVVPPPSAHPLHGPITPSPDRSLSPPRNLTLRHTSAVHCTTFSPDGEYIISGCGDNAIMVWDAKTGILALGPLNTHTNRVNCVAFSPDGKRIASGSFDLTILVWDAVTGKVVAGAFKGHTSIILSVSFSPDGKRIASGSWDETIRVCDARTGTLLVGPLTGHTNWVTTVTFSRDGQKLVSGSDDTTVRVWSARSGRAIHRLAGHTNSVEFVAFSPNGERIVSADDLGDVCVWDTDTGTLVSGPSKRHAEGTLALVFTSSNTWFSAASPDGNWIAGRKASDWTTIVVWDSKTGRRVATFSSHTDTVMSVSFSSDSRRILSVSNDTTIRVHTLC